MFQHRISSRVSAALPLVCMSGLSFSVCAPSLLVVTQTCVLTSAPRPNAFSSSWIVNVVLCDMSSSHADIRNTVVFLMLLIYSPFFLQLPIIPVPTSQAPPQASLQQLQIDGSFPVGLLGFVSDALTIKPRGQSLHTVNVCVFAYLWVRGLGTIVNFDRMESLLQRKPCCVTLLGSIWQQQQSYSNKVMQ